MPSHQYSVSLLEEGSSSGHPKDNLVASEASCGLGGQDMVEVNGVGQYIISWRERLSHTLRNSIIKKYQILLHSIKYLDTSNVSRWNCLIRMLFRVWIN